MFYNIKMRLLGLLSLLFISIQPGYTQLNFGTGYHASGARLFNWKDGANDFINWYGYGLDWYIGYRFKEKESLYRRAYGIQINIQRFQRGALNTGYTYLRFPLKYIVSIPNEISADQNKIFEYVGGIGYYLSKPFNGIGLPSNTNVNPKYWSHGILVDMGINFHIQKDLFFFVLFHQGIDIGHFSIDNNDYVQQFSDRGLTIGYHSSFCAIINRWKKVFRRNMN